MDCPVEVGRARLFFMKRCNGSFSTYFLVETKMKSSYDTINAYQPPEDCSFASLKDYDNLSAFHPTRSVLIVRWRSLVSLGTIIVLSSLMHNPLMWHTHPWLKWTAFFLCVALVNIDCSVTVCRLLLPIPYPTGTKLRLYPFDMTPEGYRPRTSQEIGEPPWFQPHLAPDRATLSSTRP